MIAFLMFSCNNNQNKEEPINSSKNYLAIGDSLSMISQQTLLGNVAREIKSGGPVHAIDFCNLNASKLMDSLSREYNVVISRVTSKARNESNIASTSELNLLKSMEASGSKDTLTTKGDQVTYYKSIKLGMPTCLKCHGAPETEINEETMLAIQKRYPNDIATNYQLGDFRGAWKIQFQD